MYHWYVLLKDKQARGVDEELRKAESPSERARLQLKLDDLYLDRIEEYRD